MERPMGELIPTKLPAAFHLGLAQNAVNFAGDGPQNANGWSAFDPIEFVKSYNERKHHIVLKMSAGVGFGDYDLVLFAVKDGSHDSNASSENHSIGDVPPTCHADRHQETMFVGITQFVERPEGIIPSFMRVERPKERLDFQREVFAPPLSVRIKFGGGISKRKIGVLGSTAPPRTATAYPHWSKADRSASMASTAASDQLSGIWCVNLCAWVVTPSAFVSVTREPGFFLKKAAMRFSSRRILSFARRKRRFGLSNKAGGLTMTKPDPQNLLSVKPKPHSEMKLGKKKRKATPKKTTKARTGRAIKKEKSSRGQEWTSPPSGLS
jgi:hypothetical protein